MQARQKKSAKRKSVKTLAARTVSSKQSRKIKGGGDMTIIKDTDKGSSK
jgi:hypothetical protein